MVTAPGLAGTPSDDLPDVLAVGGSDTSTVVASLSARHPEGRDAEYLRWHALDHRPEQHRVPGIRGSLRLVSTPACRAARAAADERHDAVDHVMLYLFADASALDGFFALGGALGAGGRMPLRLPSVGLDTYDVRGRRADPAVVVGADVLPWRPWVGVQVLLEQGGSPPDGLVEVDGVAGAWWATSTTSDVQLSLLFLDAEPAVVGERLGGVLERRWSDGASRPLLAAPFQLAVPHEWDRYLP